MSLGTASGRPDKAYFAVFNFYQNPSEIVNLT